MTAGQKMLSWQTKADHKCREDAGGSKMLGRKITAANNRYYAEDDSSRSQTLSHRMAAADRRL